MFLIKSKVSELIVNILRKSFVILELDCWKSIEIHLNSLRSWRKISFLRIINILDDLLWFSQSTHNLNQSIIEMKVIYHWWRINNAFSAIKPAYQKSPKVIGSKFRSEKHFNKSNQSRLLIKSLRVHYGLISI